MCYNIKTQKGEIMLRLLLTFTLFFTACTEKHMVIIDSKPAPKELSIKTISKVTIPVREHGYKNFKTQVIKTKNELDDFIADIKGQTGWSKKDNFLQSLLLKEINFTEYNLLLYRITESSGSTVLAVDAPKGDQQNITVKIGRDRPNVGTDDMAYYTLAYKIIKTVNTITFDNGIKKDVIENSTSQSNINRDNIPKDCLKWFDGCNNCGRVGYGIPACTELSCTTYKEFKCTKWK